MEKKSLFLIISILIVLNIICLIVIGLQQSAIKSLKKNTVSLAPGISIPDMELTPIDQQSTTESKKIKLIFIFKSPCSACNTNLATWKKLAQYFGGKIEVLGIILDGRMEAQRLLDETLVNFQIYVPENIEAFKEKMHIILNMAQTIIVSDNKIMSIHLGTLKHTDIQTIMRIIDKALQET